MCGFHWFSTFYQWFSDGFQDGFHRFSGIATKLDCWWCLGLADRGSACPWTLWPLDPLGPWPHWPLGPLIPWPFGPLALWPLGPFGTLAFWLLQCGLWFLWPFGPSTLWTLEPRQLTTEQLDKITNCQISKSTIQWFDQYAHWQNNKLANWEKCHLID